jgi:hypothetical protein
MLAIANVRLLVSAQQTHEPQFHYQSSLCVSISSHTLLDIQMYFSAVLMPLALSTPAAASTTGAQTTHVEVQATVGTGRYTAADHKCRRTSPKDPA